MSDTVGPVTLLRSLPWHWLLQQLKCQEHKGTAEPTAWNSSLCHILYERKRCREDRREGEVGRRTEREERRRKERGKKSHFLILTRLFGSILEPKCLLSTTHTMCFWKKQKCTCSSLAIGNNSQYTDKQILEHMFLNSLETAVFSIFFFQVASNLLCRGSHLLVCTVLNHNKE